jgi:sulfur-oxidizing protein SoxY
MDSDLVKRHAQSGGKIGPNVLAAVFNLPAGTAAEVTTRVKMGKTAHVVALVKADGKYYRTSKEVKVTAGGCGG